MFLAWRRPQNKVIGDIRSYDLSGALPASIAPQGDWGTYFVQSGLSPGRQIYINITVSYKDGRLSLPMKVKYDVPYASECCISLKIGKLSVSEKKTTLLFAGLGNEPIKWPFFVLLILI